MNTLGIDISSGDGIWNAETSRGLGVEFATIRATWRDNQIDARFADNWACAAVAGIKRLAYHWYVPRVDPIAQAQWFVSRSSLSELPRMVDLEDSGTVKGYVGVADEIRRFLDEVFRLTGERCLIYTNVKYAAYFRRPVTGNPAPRDSWLATYPLVVASWESNAPSIPWPWHRNRWTAWQFTGAAHGPTYGIEGWQTSLYVWNGAL